MLKTNNIYYILIILASILLFVSNANSSDKYIRLSLENMVLFAFNENPDIEMSKIREEQAQHKIGEAKSEIYPKLRGNAKLNTQYNTNERAGPTALAHYFGLSGSQLIYDGNSAKSLIQQKRQLRKSVRIETEIAQEKVLFDVFDNYFQIMRLQNTVVENVNLIKELENITNKLKFSEEAGGANKAKVEYAKARLAFAKNQYTDTVTALNDTISNLEALTGPLPKFYAVYPHKINWEQYKLDDYIAFAKEFNNGVLLNNSDIEALEYRLDSEKGKYFPKIQLTLNGSKSFNDGGSTIGTRRELIAGVEMTHDFLDGFARSSAIKRISSEIKELKIKRRKLEKDLIRDITQAYNQLTAIVQLITSIKDEINANIALQKLNRQNFEMGDVDIIRLIEGEERLNISKSKLHELMADYYLNMYGLLLRAGLLDKSFFCVSC